MRLYRDLAPWFHLLTAPTEYAEEAERYRELILAACPDARTLLELGSGGGNNASHLTFDFACTLTDLSPEMLDLSRTLNPGCEHLLGDMRSLRLARTFDAVLVHDAVMYLTTEAELVDCARTAVVHLRPAGVALFVPDCTLEGYRPGVSHGGHDGADGRSLRYLEWCHPASGDPTVAEVDLAILLRTGNDPAEVVHDRHVIGLFEEETWRRVLGGVGLDVTVHAGDVDGAGTPQPVFVGVRRA